MNIVKFLLVSFKHNFYVVALSGHREQQLGNIAKTLGTTIEAVFN